MLASIIASSINQQVWEFLLSGGAFMFCIVGCSLVSAAIVIHRLLSLKRDGVMPATLVAELKNIGEDAGRLDSAALRFQAEESETPLGEIVVAALGKEEDETVGRDVEEISRSTEAVAREEVLRLQTGLSVLEDIITIAPLLGLLGTVSGLVGVFAELGSAGADSADPAVLAGGIARALNTTIAGLAVAVPTVIMRSFFSKKIETMSARMEVLVGRLVYAVAGKSSAAAVPVPNVDTAPVPSAGAPPLPSAESRPQPVVAAPPQQPAATPAPLPFVAKVDEEEKGPKP